MCSARLPDLPIAIINRAQRNGQIAWYAHAVCSQVSQAQNTLAVGNNDNCRLLHWPIFEYLRNGAKVFDGDVEAARALEDVAVLLACFADGWSVCNVRE